MGDNRKNFSMGKNLYPSWVGDPGELLEDILDTSLNALVLYKSVRDGNGVVFDFEFVIVNKVAAGIMGYPAEGLVGRTLNELFPGQEKGGFHRMMEVVESGERRIWEHSFRHEQFDHYFEITAAPFKDGVLLSFNDITEKRRTEQRLREQERLLSEVTELQRQEERLKELNAELEKKVNQRTQELDRSRRQLNLLIDSVPALLSYIDRNYNYRFMNQLYETWFGLDRRESIGQHMSEVLGEEAFRKLKPYADQALSGTPAGYETYLPYKAGGRHISARYIPDINSSGEVLGMFVLVSDISEAVRAQQEARDSAERFRTLIETIPNIAWTTLPDGRGIYHNKRWSEYTGLPPEAGDGDGWKQILHPDDLDEALKRYAVCLESGTPFEIEYRIRRYDGVYKWFLGRALPVRDSEGKISLWVGTDTDIDQQKKYREELERKNAELNRINADLDTVLYTASHDLKSPVSNIEGLVDMLREVASPELVGNADFSQVMDLISGSVVRFRQSIHDLSNTAQIQDSLVRDLEEVDIQELIEDVRLGLWKEISNARAIIRIDTLSCPAIRFSRKGLRSIVFNLLSNAIKYRSLERPPLIKISTEYAGSGIILSVKDNGLGIPGSNRDKIFAMFKRLHHHVDGTGVGLYIVRRIVENAGGSIDLESEVGKGSLFRVFLPEQKNRRTEEQRNR